MRHRVTVGISDNEGWVVSMLTEEGWRTKALANREDLYKVLGREVPRADELADRELGCGDLWAIVWLAGYHAYAAKMEGMPDAVAYFLQLEAIYTAKAEACSGPI